MPQNAANRAEIESLLVQAIADTAQSPPLRVLYQELEAGRKRLIEPMRVAVVGVIKAGKSTLMNALLGNTVVATGRFETTYNVNWIEYADAPRLTVQYKDGRPDACRPFEDLAALTVRPHSADPEMEAIARLRVGYPSDLLRTMSLIDTPGFASIYGTDQQNALAALGLSGTVSPEEAAFLRDHGEAMTKSTVDQIAIADAVLFLYRYAPTASLFDTLKLFLGSSADRTTPLNSIGILTKTDDLWKPSSMSEEEMPCSAFGALARIASLMIAAQKERPATKRLLYEILPVSSLLAEGAARMTCNDFQDLLVLSRLDRNELRYAIRDDLDFIDAALLPGLPVPARARLKALLGLFGVWTACEYLRFCNKSPEVLVEHLIEESGVSTVCRLIESHFGARSHTIKLDSLIRRLDMAVTRLRPNLDAAALPTLIRMEATIRQMRDLCFGAGAVRVLQGVYEDRLTLNPALLRDITRVAGESGQTPAERLDLPPTATMIELEAAADRKISEWRSLLQTFRLASPEAKNAIVFTSQSYERVGRELKEARCWIAQANLETDTPSSATEPAQAAVQIATLQALAQASRNRLLALDGTLGIPKEDAEAALRLLDPQSPSLAARLGVNPSADFAQFHPQLNAILVRWRFHRDYWKMARPQSAQLAADIVRVTEYLSHCVHRAQQLLAGEG